jgi:hypothetical protein
LSNYVFDRDLNSFSIFLIYAVSSPSLQHFINSALRLNCSCFSALLSSVQS